MSGSGSWGTSISKFFGGGRVDVQQLHQGQLGQGHLVAGRHHVQVVGGQLRFAVEHRAFGNTAGFQQQAGALQLGIVAIDVQLVGAHQLFGQHQLQVLRGHVQAQVVAGFGNVLHAGLVVQFIAPDGIAQLKSLKQHHLGRPRKVVGPNSLALVLVGQRVHAGAKLPGLRAVQVHRGQQRSLALREGGLVALGGILVEPHAQVMLQGVVHGALQGPGAGGGLGRAAERRGGWRGRHGRRLSLGPRGQQQRGSQPCQRQAPVVQRTSGKGW